MPSLIDANTDQVLFKNLIVADRFFSRARGLLGRIDLSNDEAILIRPCRSIHTWFMRMPITVAFVGADGQVLVVHENVRPWRMLWGPSLSDYVVEYSPRVNVLKPDMIIKQSD